MLSAVEVEISIPLHLGQQLSGEPIRWNHTLPQPWHRYHVSLVAPSGSPT
jgi:hypothetical protein